MRDWVVAGGLVESGEGLLLVRNRRRDGSHDWTPPGGVVEVGDGEAVADGLTREVREETGLSVTAWEGPVYRVVAEAPDMGWRMTVEVHRALAWDGAITVDDPDGIVVEARFVPCDECESLLAAGALWLVEPLTGWLAERWRDERSYRYRV